MPVVALCTFTPDGGSPFNLGTEDCWVDVRKEVGRTIYTVTSHYINREGNRFYLEGATRAQAEIYVRDLAESFSARPLISTEGPTGEVYYPDASALRGTLENPYTELSEDNCYCVGIEHADEGSRRYGIVFTFEQPDVDVDDIDPDDVIQFKGINLGNLPGFIKTNILPNFVEYEATFFFRGSNTPDYPEILSTAVEMLPIIRQPIVRADLGFLGQIKSWNATPGQLLWSPGSVDEPTVYIESLTNTREADGFLSMNALFVKGR